MIGSKFHPFSSKLISQIKTYRKNHSKRQTDQPCSVSEADISRWQWGRITPHGAQRGASPPHSINRLVHAALAQKHNLAPVADVGARYSNLTLVFTKTLQISTTASHKGCENIRPHGNCLSFGAAPFPLLDVSSGF